METIQNILNQELTANGTGYYFDDIKATYSELVAILGEPIKYTDNNKTNFEWIKKIGDNVFTLYDWKENSFDDNTAINWHIGGYNKETTSKVKLAIEQLLKKI